jgi:5-methylcytosine-specific restriction endonuclease McrA
MAEPVYKSVGLPRKDPRYMVIWWEINKDVATEVRKKNYQDNREIILREQKAYVEARPELKAKILARVKAWQKAFPDKVNKKNSAWRAANPEARSIEKARRRTLMAGASGSHAKAEAKAILTAQKHLCANPYCRSFLAKGNKHLDHIMPLSRGGSNYASNLQWLCVSCNTGKHDAFWEEWLETDRQAREAARR